MSTVPAVSSSTAKNKKQGKGTSEATATDTGQLLFPLLFLDRSGSHFEFDAGGEVDKSQLMYDPDLVEQANRAAKKAKDVKRQETARQLKELSAVVNASLLLPPHGASLACRPGARRSFQEAC
jgi:membrane protein involved in colicin uptake